MVRRTVSAVVFVAALGCGGRHPSAPALTADEEYHDANAGLRFPTPPGYRIFVKAALPPGRLDQPVLLAAYQNTAAKVRSAIEVMAADVPGDQDLAAYLAAHPVGSEKWRAKPPAESVTVGGRPGRRMAFTYRDEREHAREVTAVRAGDRAYFLIVVYPPDDTAARDAGRAVIDKVEWLKRD
jgi:hypothetical protein